jgi:hypothetical protein
MNVDGMVKRLREPCIRERCQLFKRADEVGLGLQPSHLFPLVTRGSNVMITPAELRKRGRDLSQWHIDWLNRLRSEFPEIVVEFKPVLEKAERIWRDCIAA